MSSGLNHYHDGADGSPQHSHGNLLLRSTHSVGHPIYLRGQAVDEAVQRGTVAFTAGVSSVAVTFATAFTVAPTITHGIERAAGSALQSSGIESVTTTGFTFLRSSGGGAATGHYIAIGVR